MPEMHLKQPGFTYSACGLLTRNKQRMQNFMQAGDTNYIYKNELNEACFQHDMAHRDFKDLKRRTQSAFKSARNPKYDGYHTKYDGNQRELLLKMKLKKIKN